MALKLMYITNRPDVARVAESCGVDRIFVDMEFIGKDARQHGLNTVQNHHTFDDIKHIREAVTKAEVMVRVNPIHAATRDYPGSEEEIDRAIEAGADLIMLPYFTTPEEVELLVRYVRGRARVFPLLESEAAVARVDEILAVDGIDEIHVGLNDLSLDRKKKFMFELMTDGTVDALCEKFRQKGLTFGIGGVGAPHIGPVPSEYIIRDHYRLGSTCAILSRSFCDTKAITDIEDIRVVFETGMPELRRVEEECVGKDDAFFEANHRMLQRMVQAYAQR